MLRRVLSRHGWLIAIAVIYLYVFPYFPRIHSANELPRVYLVKAIADDHTFAIDHGIARWPVSEGGGPTADISPSNHHQYSNKAPGSSMLAVPPYLIAKLVAGEPSLPATVWICRVFTGIVPMLLFLALLYRFLERYVPDPAIRQLVCLAYGLGSLAMTYSILYFSHQLAAICVASAWMIGVQTAARERTFSWFCVAGGLAGASALVDYQAVFAVVPVALHIGARLWTWPWRERLGAMAMAAAAGAVPVAILLGYHAICFGSPWRTGYDASVTFAANHQQGFLGLTELRWDAFWGSTFKLDNGLFALSPWLLLAFPGSYVLARGLHRPEQPVLAPLSREARRSHGILVGVGGVLLIVAIAGLDAYPYGRWIVAGWVGLIGVAVGLVVVHARGLLRGGDFGTAMVGLWIAILYLLFISAINFWRGGWGVGPRYITVMVPFLLPAIAAFLAWLRRWPLVLGAAAGLIVVGIVVYTLSSATFPYWPDTLRHPLFEITFRMLINDLAAPTAASALGIDGVLGILPVVVLVAGVVGWAIHRVVGIRGVALATGVAVIVFVAYAFAPRGGAEADRAFSSVRQSVLNVIRVER